MTAMLKTHSGEIRVKLLGKGAPTFPREHMLWRFPQHDGVWGRCQFLFEPDERNYDWLVVYDDLTCREGGERTSLRVEELSCPREHSLLVTAEPSSVKVYADSFTSQFGVVLTSQEPWAIRHPNAVYSQCGLLWFYGHDYPKIAASVPLPKSGGISTVCSSKQQSHTLHALRYQFTQKLKAAMPELEVFGHGVRPINDKSEAVAPYRYHLAIENHLATHHWTEKLADTFLGLALPLYFGCPNVFDYFPEESLIPVDIRQEDEAMETIARALRDNEWEHRLPAIQEARRLCLEQYHLFAVLERLITERHDPNRKDSGALIRSRKAARNQSLGKMMSHGLEVVRNRLWHFFVSK